MTAIIFLLMFQSVLVPVYADRIINMFQVVNFKSGVAIIDFAWATGNGYVLRQNLEKKNDPVSGKPAITLNTTTMLVSADNKPPWKL